MSAAFYCSQVPYRVPVAPGIGCSYITGQSSIQEVRFSGLEIQSPPELSLLGAEVDYGVLQNMSPGPMLGLCTEALQADEWEGSGL